MRGWGPEPFIIMKVYHGVLILFLTRATIQFSMQSPGHGYRAWVSRPIWISHSIQDIAVHCISQCWMCSKTSPSIRSFSQSLTEWDSRR